MRLQAGRVADRQEMPRGDADAGVEQGLNRSRSARRWLIFFSFFDGDKNTARKQNIAELRRQQQILNRHQGNIETLQEHSIYILTSSNRSVWSFFFFFFEPIGARADDAAARS